MLDTVGNNREHSYVLGQIDKVESKLDAALNNKNTCTEDLFELICHVQILLARLAGHQLGDSTKELTRDLKNSVSLQQGTYNGYKIQGAKYTAAFIQLAGAACGIQGLMSGSQALSGLAMPVSYAGQGISGIAQTGEESQNSYRIVYQHEAEEAKRRRDESTGTKNRFSQEVQELQQLYQRTIESTNRAKTAAAA